MVEEAKVKEYFPKKFYGFLYNPEGGKDIFFRLNGCAGRRPVEIRPGVTLLILKKSVTEAGPRATRWEMGGENGSRQ